MNYFKEYEALKEVRKLIPIHSEWVCVKPRGNFDVGDVVYIQKIWSTPSYTTETVVNFSYDYYGKYEYLWFSKTKEQFLWQFRPSDS